MKFAITDEDGSYSLSLKKDRTYDITVSYIGYDDELITIEVTGKSTLNFSLKESSNKLEAVVIEQAVVVKKDTTLYNPNKFINGKERKLKQVLNKIPGMEVDKLGNVTVNWKSVKKLLIDGEKFFTGDPKLGVNNIPADAVDRIEVYDNQNDIGFLKDLEDSDILAINIKLKEGKKNFVFGDVSVGSGVADSENYLVNPSLFYYSPKTTVNLITDLSNRGEKSFSVSDYQKFESGRGIGFNEYNDLSNTLSDNRFNKSQHQFGAFNFRQKLRKELTFNSYAIVLNERNQTKGENRNVYNLGVGNVIENRDSRNRRENLFGIAKVKVHYTPNLDTDFALNATFRANRFCTVGSILSSFRNSKQYINSSYNKESFSFNQNIEWHKKYSTEHTFSIVGDYRFVKRDPKQNWKTNQPILTSILPLQGNDAFNLSQNKNFKKHFFDFDAKHYWVLNGFNHIYTTVGSSFRFEDFNTSTYETLQGDIKNNFENANFNNKVRYSFNDSYVGLQYKFRRKKFIVKPGLYYHI